jgi:hypothetical protein
MKLPRLWEIREEAGDLLARVLCSLLGHKKPYERHLTANICPRCSIVVEEKIAYIKTPLSPQMEAQLEWEKKHQPTHPQTLQEGQASVAQPAEASDSKSEK